MRGAYGETIRIHELIIKVLLDGQSSSFLVHVYSLGTNIVGASDTTHARLSLLRGFNQPVPVRRQGCLLANRTWDESAQSPNIFCLFTSSFTQSNFLFSDEINFSLGQYWCLWLCIYSNLDVINYTKLLMLDMCKICLILLYLTWLKQLLCRWAILACVYICQCPEWFDQLDVIYTIALLKLCFLRLSLDRNHAESLADFLNIQTRHLQLLSDPRKLLSVSGVLLTPLTAISSDKQMCSRYHRIWSHGQDLGLV